jgi:hypothetical protein
VFAPKAFTLISVLTTPATTNSPREASGWVRPRRATPTKNGVESQVSSAGQA